MKSLLAALLLRNKAEEVTPDMQSMRDGTGDLRAAMGISHLPEDKPVIYFLFQNGDHGPEQRYWETPDDTPSDALNRASLRAFTHPSSRSIENFDQQHYLEISGENTRPTMAANRAMAFSIDSLRKFEQLSLRVGRAFLADTVCAGDLSLTLVFVPALDPAAQLPLQKVHQVTYTPSLNPVRVMPPPSASEPELNGMVGQQAWDTVQAAIKKAATAKFG